MSTRPSSNGVRRHCIRYGPTFGHCTERLYFARRINVCYFLERKPDLLAHLQECHSVNPGCDAQQAIACRYRGLEIISKLHTAAKFAQDLALSEALRQSNILARKSRPDVGVAKRIANRT